MARTEQEGVRFTELETKERTSVLTPAEKAELARLRQA